jgi:hypothetical protein
MEACPLTHNTLRTLYRRRYTWVFKIDEAKFNDTPFALHCIAEAEIQLQLPLCA